MKRQTAKFVRAFTMAELVIVMALLSIVSLLIVSFASMTSTYFVRIVQNQHTIEDVEYAQEALNTFLHGVDSTEYTISTDGHSLFATSSRKNLYISFDDGFLTGITAVDGVLNLPFESISSISFSMQEPSSSSGALICCNIEYVVSHNKTKEIKHILYFYSMRSTVLTGDN